MNAAWHQTYVLRLQAAPAVDGLAGEIEQVHSGRTQHFHDEASLIAGLRALLGASAASASEPGAAPERPLVGGLAGHTALGPGL